MNKQRFIERLNLYLDKELSEVESEAFLDAVRNNPEYQRLFVQYCQLHKACAQLGNRFLERKTTASWRQKAYAVGGMAAAAALLLLAARNLSPLIGTPDGGEALTAIGQAPKLAADASGTSERPERPVATGVNSLEEAPLRFGDRSSMPVFFTIDSAFELGDTPRPVADRSNIELAAFGGREQEGQATDSWERDFTFGKAVQTSTFEHESLSSGEADLEAFSARAVGTAFDRTDSSLRFEVRRAAATAAGDSLR